MAKAWMLERVDEAANRRDWSKLPQGFELDAVRMLFTRTLKVHFDRRDIRPRINASNAQTFSELREAIEATKHG